MSRNLIGVWSISCVVGACASPPGVEDESKGVDSDEMADSTPLTGGAAGAGSTGEGSGAPPDGPSAGMTGAGEPATTSGADPTSEESDDDSTPIFFDVGTIADAPPPLCGAPSPVECDHLDDDPWHALGLNCPGGPQVDGTVDLTGPEQLHIHEGNLGTYTPAPFPPREGTKFVVLSSGAAIDLTVPGSEGSTDVGGFVPGSLPPPIVSTSVSATEDCEANPGLIGTGDCSNTIQAQLDQGFGVYDYAQLRLTTEVPSNTFGFSYDFAMFSTEYPVFYQTTYNDMYIAWLESENWTGNISFDDMGNPISLNAGFLDFKDATNPFDCPAPCQAPELQGTGMVGHAGTRWLTSSAGVTPGETIELIFAIFDLSDGSLDTAVILDNFKWDCDGGPPVTVPG